MSEGLVAVALGAGMLAALNPCGFALLPAYVSLLLAREQAPSRAATIGRALALTAAMTAGFAGVFLAFGLAVAPVASQVQQHLPWVTVTLGLLLTGLGIWLAAGRTLVLPGLRRGSTGTSRPLRRSFTSMAGFGAGYAVASLSCTIAPFLAVVVAGFRSGSVLEGAVLFLAYAAGMGAIVGALALATALASQSLTGRMRRAGALVPRVGGALLAVAGAYVAWYGAWELRVLGGADASDPVVDAASEVQRAAVGVATAVGPGGWALVAAALAVVGLLAGRLRPGRRRARRTAGVPTGGTSPPRSRTPTTPRSRGR